MRPRWPPTRQTRKHGCRSVSRILSSPSLRTEEAAISLGGGLLRRSCGLPESSIPPWAEREASSFFSHIWPCSGGVCRAPGITPGAVSSYLAFSPLPRGPGPVQGAEPWGGMFSVTLSVPARLHGRAPRYLRGTLLYGVRTFLIPPGAERGCPTCNRELFVYYIYSKLTQSAREKQSPLLSREGFSRFDPPVRERICILVLLAGDVP